MSGKTAFIFAPAFLNYKFMDDHPFHPKRLEITLDLLEQLGLLPQDQILSPRPATVEELALVHDPIYIQAVQQASQAADKEGGEEREEWQPFGIGTEDNPIFPDMHEAARWVVGGTVMAAESVMEGRFTHAVNLAGGLHHAHRGQASGFCIYNDAAVAISVLKQKYPAIRIAYIDTDAHHGDGVQWLFYDDPDVLTISLHETGKYLFPGTGNLEERGDGPGYGYSFNLPLEAYTEDESYLECLQGVLTPLLHRFNPDLILSQNGCDAHYYDPLTHLAVSTKIYQEIPRIIHELAHEFCEGRLVAIGGGGYDWWRVVPRAWSLLWSELSHQPLPECLPLSWREKWQGQSPFPLPNRFIDEEGSFPPIPRRQEISEKNRITMRQALLGTPFLL